MKLITGIILSSMVGAFCCCTNIPVPSPQYCPGALLVVAMTFGHSATNKVLVCPIFCAVG